MVRLTDNDGDEATTMQNTGDETAGGFACSPVHDGPFFFERKGVCRCDGCGQLVTDDQVRDSFRDYFGIMLPPEAAQAARADAQHTLSYDRVLSSLRVFAAFGTFGLANIQVIEFPVVPTQPDTDGAERQR